MGMEPAHSHAEARPWWQSGAGAACDSHKHSSAPRGATTTASPRTASSTGMSAARGEAESRQGPLKAACGADGFDRAQPRLPGNQMWCVPRGREEADRSLPRPAWPSAGSVPGLTALPPDPRPLFLGREVTLNLPSQCAQHPGSQGWRNRVLQVLEKPASELQRVASIVPCMV